jgi:hypothetical protein
VVEWNVYNNFCCCHKSRYGTQKIIKIDEQG